MKIELKTASTQEEKTQIYNFRYQVYVKEMKIFQDVADHQKGELKSETDHTGRLIYASLEGKVIGAIRMHLGKDYPMPLEFYNTYNLFRFCSVLRPEAMAVITRFMIAPAFRGTRVSFLLIKEVARICITQDRSLSRKI